ncbi:MAG: O-antigen ligase family protein [Xanthobacteraceae bacterium]
MLDRKGLPRIADWLAVATAVSLPWSTSATSILLGAWLVILLASLDLGSVRRVSATAAGGLPILLWLLAAIGMLWADVGWPDRFGGLSGFHRLLATPLLLAQFRRSEKGVWVLSGFLAAAVVLMLASWISYFNPDLKWPWPHVNPILGVPVKDVISQSTIFIVCAFGLIWRVCDLSRRQNWRTALLLAGLATLFVANLVFVAVARGDVVAAPILMLLLGWRQFRLKGAVIAGLVGCLLAAGAWTASPYLRGRLITAVHDVTAYRASHADNDVGDHVEFIKKSLRFVAEAPFIGHGTGSIAEMFRRSSIGESGAAAIPTVNPHNQVFAVAIQLGLLGAFLLLAMWLAHYLLFRVPGFAAWIGTVVVVENVVSSLTSSHLFDFMHGWLYVVGVGVAGGMVLRRDASVPLEGAMPLAGGDNAARPHPDAIS